MLKITTKKIRRTTLCVATALAISLPGTATAGLLDKKKGPKPVVHLGNVVKKAGKTVAKAAKKGPAPLPGEELIDLVRGAQASLLFQICYLLDDPMLEEPELEDFGWGLFQVDREGFPVRPIKALHESVLETDPTGREMRPRQSDA